MDKEAWLNGNPLDRSIVSSELSSSEFPSVSRRKKFLQELTDKTCKVPSAELVAKRARDMSVGSKFFLPCEALEIWKIKGVNYLVLDASRRVVSFYGFDSYKRFNILLVEKHDNGFYVTLLTKKQDEHYKWSILNPLKSRNFNSMQWFSSVLGFCTKTVDK